jgi:hypothetical protein
MTVNSTSILQDSSSRHEVRRPQHEDCKRPTTMKILSCSSNLGQTTRLTGRLTVFLKQLDLVSMQCGGRSEYLHRIPGSRKRRRKGDQVPTGI